MQLSLRATDLIELEELTKFVSKSKEAFGNIYINNSDGRLVALASDGFILRSVELSDTRKLSNINVQLKVDSSLKGALKALVTEFKKYPDQSINMNRTSISALDLSFKITVLDDEYPYFEFDKNVHSYFSVNLKLLEMAIRSMNDDSAYFILPNANADRVIIRGKSGEMVAIGVKGSAV